MYSMIPSLKLVSIDWEIDIVSENIFYLERIFKDDTLGNLDY